MWQAYKAFLFRGNLLELAVAFILGVSFNAIVQALANDVILGTITEAVGLDSVLELRVGPVLVGTLLGALIAFVIVATVLFGIVRLAERVRTEEEPAAEAAPEEDSPELRMLTEIRDLLAQR